MGVVQTNEFSMNDRRFIRGQSHVPHQISDHRCSSVIIWFLRSERVNFVIHYLQITKNPDAKSVN